ncbi:hypothetical protein A2011_01390, partial [candidate division CPR3 bacterium GWE2_35_7]
MKSFWKLFIARIKMFLRQKDTLFWMIFFPIMFILIFGLFNFDKMGVSNVALIDNADSEFSKDFVDNLKKVEVLKIDDNYQNEEEAKNAVLDGDLDFVFIIPQNFNLQMTESGPSRVAVEPIQVFYDKSNVQLNGIVFGLLEQFMSGMNIQIFQTPQVFSYEKQEIESKNINYLDVLVPGIIGMSLMQGGLFGIAMSIVSFREKHTLRKLMSTPLRTRSFLLAFVLSNLLISLIQMTLIILISLFIFKVHIFGNIFYLYFIGLLGQLIFLSLGFAVAGVAKTVDAAQGMIQVVSMPMMFLSGVFFSKEALPDVIKNVVSYLPLTPFIEALRKIALQDANLFELQTELLFMGGW